MTYASKLTKALFSSPEREYIQAVPVGWEDATGKAQTVTRLLRHCFGVPGHFRTMLEGVVDMLLFGTAIIEVGWKYEEREMPVRSVESVAGVELSSTQRMRVPVYNDVVLSVVDPVDFYPDPSEYRIENMSGVAKRFKMTRLKAKALAESGIYDKSAVEKAVRDGGSDSKRPTHGAEDIRLDLPDREVISDFGEMVGYEYYGDVPWSDDQGSSRRVITVLNGHVVRDEPYPFADYCLPFHSLIINPVNGRFYGVSPAEVIKYDQDFADALKMLTAEAVVRAVHPPIAYDIDSEVDVNKLRKWKADLPVGIRGGPNSIGTLRYDANVFNAFNMQMSLTQSMQGASGASGAIQGENGPDREAATAAAFRLEAAMDRPELAAMVLENECLPPIGRAILRRYQQFITDTKELNQLIGEQPESVWIGDILAEYDVQFVGSRMASSKQQKLAAYDRLGSMSAAIPELRAMIPWTEIGRDMIGRVLDLPEIAGLIGSPQVMLQNLLMSRMSGATPGAGNGNGQLESSAPPGLMPAQVAGEELGGS